MSVAGHMGFGSWSAVTLLVLQHGPLGSPRSLYFFVIHEVMYLCMYFARDRVNAYSSANAIPCPLQRSRGSVPLEPCGSMGDLCMLGYLYRDSMPPDHSRGSVHLEARGGMKTNKKETKSSTASETTSTSACICISASDSFVSHCWR